jgi:hypothetical protein
MHFVAHLRRVRKEQNIEKTAFGPQQLSHNCGSGSGSFPFYNFFQWFFQLIQGRDLSFSSVIISFTDGRTHRTSDQLVERSLPKHRTTETE